MKRKLCVLALFLCLIFDIAIARGNGDVFDPNEIKSIDGISILDKRFNRMMSLNSDQLNQFVSCMSFSRRTSPKKTSLHYALWISYGSKSTVLYTDGKTVEIKDHSVQYEFENDCSDLLKSFFAVYDYFLESIPRSPLKDKVCLYVSDWAGIEYVLSEIEDGRYYVLEIVNGSGLPVVSIKGFDVKLKDGSLGLDDGKRISIENGSYRFFINEKEYVCKISSDLDIDVSTAMYAYTMYHRF